MNQATHSKPIHCTYYFHSIICNSFDHYLKHPFSSPTVSMQQVIVIGCYAFSTLNFCMSYGISCLFLLSVLHSTSSNQPMILTQTILRHLLLHDSLQNIFSLLCLSNLHVFSPKILHWNSALLQMLHRCTLPLTLFAFYLIWYLLAPSVILHIQIQAKQCNASITHACMYSISANVKNTLWLAYTTLYHAVLSNFNNSV